MNGLLKWLRKPQCRYPRREGDNAKNRVWKPREFLLFKRLEFLYFNKPVQSSSGEIYNENLLFIIEIIICRTPPCNGMIWGAATPPIRAAIEPSPRPVDLASVGYISGA